MIAEKYHIPVLLGESIAGLAIRPAGIYVDLTFGGGGHAREILRKLKRGRLVAFDRDPAVTAQTINYHRFQLIPHNYRYFSYHLQYLGIQKVDGILADLGVSSRQFDDPERGFSFRYDADLDMRMNPAGAVRAADLIDQMTAEEMTKMLRQYGELHQAGRIAGRIIHRHQVHPIKTTGDLADAVRDLFPKNQENKMLAQVFQAFRIAVNDEQDSLREMLMQTAAMLRSGGRLVVISYHSLEDRLVKHFMRAGNFTGSEQTDLRGNRRVPFVPVSRKAIQPGKYETDRNPRARSARLRIAERTDMIL